MGKITKQRKKKNKKKYKKKKKKKKDCCSASVAHAKLASDFLSVLVVNHLQPSIYLANALATAGFISTSRLH